MTYPTASPRQRLTGIALMCGAVACFGCLDATGKYLNLHMNTMEVVWARYASGFVLAFAISNPLTKPGIMITSRPLLQLTRSVLMLSGALLNFVALRYLQMDQTQSIVFSTPFLVSALAGPMLGEWIGWRRWIAIVVGFMGVMLVIRPGLNMHPAALISVAAAFCYALYNITTRMLSRSDSNETQLFYGNLVGVGLMSLVVPFVWTTPDSFFVVAMMIFAGVLGSFGHYLMIAGHKLAPASLLSPFMYTLRSAKRFLVESDQNKQNRSLAKDSVVGDC